MVNSERPDRLCWGIVTVSEIRKTAPPKAGTGASFVAMRLLWRGRRTNSPIVMKAIYRASARNQPRCTTIDGAATV